MSREYGVLRLDVFGSAMTEAFDAGTSDVDFVVTFANTRTPGYADRYLGLAESLESLLGRSVDLVVDRAIRNHYFREAVEATRRPVYSMMKLTRQLPPKRSMRGEFGSDLRKEAGQ